MRKLIVSNLISLDGYASGLDGDVMALPFDSTFSNYNLELMEAADTMVSGATTYRGFVSYWPPVADDPSQPEVERAILRRQRELAAFSVRPPGAMRLTGARTARRLQHRAAPLLAGMPRSTSRPIIHPIDLVGDQHLQGSRLRSDASKTTQLVAQRPRASIPNGSQRRKAKERPQCPRRTGTEPRL